MYTETQQKAISLTISNIVPSKGYSNMSHHLIALRSIIINDLLIEVHHSDNDTDGPRRIINNSLDIIEADLSDTRNYGLHSEDWPELDGYTEEDISKVISDIREQINNFIS